jgi:HD-GYP domain-containing protein (c-di-GMP phosphodiesterase class II)
MGKRAGRKFTPKIAASLEGSMPFSPEVILLAVGSAVGGALVGNRFFARAAPPGPLVPAGPDAYAATIRTLASVIDASDPFARGRSERIARISVKLGARLGLPATELRDLEYAALLHDIGKTAIHYDILVKAGRLSERETESVRNHPEIGWRILKEIPILQNAADLVLAHHEQPDGKGYPNGLSGKAIPTGSRIIMAVAAYDAMISDRPYRTGLSSEDALQELRKCCGRMFFQEIVDELLELHKSGAIFEPPGEEDGVLLGELPESAAAKKLAGLASQAGEPEKARPDWVIK